MTMFDFLLKKYKDYQISVKDDIEFSKGDNSRVTALLALYALTPTRIGGMIQFVASDMLKNQFKVAAKFVKEKRLTEEFPFYDRFLPEDFIISDLNLELRKLIGDYEILNEREKLMNKLDTDK